MTVELRQAMQAVALVVERTSVRVNSPTPRVMQPGLPDSYPVTETRCFVCMSEHRKVIERMLAEGMSHRSIADVVNVGLDSEDHPRYIRPRSIGNHYKRNHMPLQKAMYTRLVEERAMELGKQVADASEMLVDHVVVGRAMLQTFYQRLVNGEVSVSSSDAVSIINAFVRLDAQVVGGVDASAYSQVVQVMVENMESVIGIEKTREILFLTSADPIVRAVMERRDGAIEATAT